MVFCITGSVFSFANYVCVEYLPLGTAGSLAHAVWMLLVPFTSTFILGEKITRMQWIAITLVIAGSALIFTGLAMTTEFDHKLELTNVPEFTNHASVNTSTVNNNVSDSYFRFDQGSGIQYKTSTIKDFVFGLCMAIVTGISGNLTTAFSRCLNQHLQTPLILAVWYNIAGTVLCGILMCIFEVNILALPSDTRGWSFLAVHVFSNVGICLTYYSAMYFASAVVCSITFNLEIPLKLLCQYVVFRSLQPINGSLYDLIGGIVITLAVILPSGNDFIKFLTERNPHSNEHESEKYSLITSKEQKLEKMYTGDKLSK